MEFKVADLNGAYRGVSLDELMAGAGREVAKYVQARFPHGHPQVLVFAGKGNNGGDGLAAALRIAAFGRATVVLAEGRAAVDPQGPSGRALQAVEGHGSIAKLEWGPKTRQAVRGALGRADLVLDCLLGSGIAGPARPPYRELIALMGKAKAPVVSVDVPSGFPFSPAVKPDVTLTIHAPKVGMSRANSGKIVPIDIGFPPAAWTHTGPGDLLLIPKVADEAQKRDRGVLAVVGGGPYSGAPALAALAAHACGVGLVHLFTPGSVADVVRRFDPTLIVHALPGRELGPSHVGGLLQALTDRRCDALAMGPGLGRSPATREAVRQVARGAKLPAVVDADAIEAVADLDAGELRSSLVTPHAGEFRRFARKAPPGEGAMDARVRAAVKAARSHRTTVVLKGHVSIVTDGSRVKLNDAGVSAMAVGGTGDVLTGITGALLAKGLTPFDAGRAGTFILGKAGELAFEDLGHSLKPTDILSKVPRVLSRYLPWWGGRP